MYRAVLPILEIGMLLEGVAPRCWVLGDSILADYAPRDVELLVAGRVDGKAGSIVGEVGGRVEGALIYWSHTRNADEASGVVRVGEGRHPRAVA